MGRPTWVELTGHGTSVRGFVPFRPQPTAGVLPSGLRIPALVAVTIAAVVFTALAIRFAGEPIGGSLDQQVDPVLSDMASQYWVTWRVVALASPPAVVTMAVLLAGLSLYVRRRGLALLALAGPGLAGVLTVVLKPIIGRTLDGTYTYPSGHTAGATAIALVFSLLVVQSVPRLRPMAAELVASVTVLVGGCVGVAMVAEGLHYASDVVGGFCAAVLAVLGTALALDRFSTR